LTAISDPKWLVNGLRHRDLAAVLYPTATTDRKGKRRRSAQVARLFRLLRAHGLLHKDSRTHRNQVPAQARTTIAAPLAAREAHAANLIAAA
jgi:hypothetical protein